MASNIQSDTSLWLHNKLGTSNDSWTGGSIVSQLTPDILKKIRNCFQDLQPQVKLKLLLSFFHIGRKNLEQWKVQLEAILEVALVDSEPWVSMLADLLTTFPASGLLNTEVSVGDNNRKIFQDLLAELRKTLKRHTDINDIVLPLECHYLNKNAFISVVGQQPQPLKHFSLKRKPKAAALKADLMQRSLEAASKVKSQTSAFPTRIRTMPKKMSDTTPLKGLPSRPLANSGFRSPRVSLPSRPGGGKKEGGVKMLEIGEQPMGYQAAKKRKRQQELEEQKKLAEEAALSANIKQEMSAAAPPAATPDYAANLSSNALPAAAPPAYAPPAPLAAPAAPAPVPQAVYAPAPPSVQPSVATGGVGGLPLATQPGALPGATVTVPLPMAPLPQNQTQTRLVQLPTHPLPRGAGPGQTIQTQQHLLQLQPQQQQVTIQQQLRPQQQQVIQQQQQQQQQPQILRQPAIQALGAPVAAAPAPRRNLSLTKDQMLEAQEMFRTANKVTRPEKALILGFMAGSRDNPCPHLGNIVTIKLSENQENVPQTDNTYLTMIVETHFQMNYNTGEWKRIKKYRRLEDVLQ